LNLKKILKNYLRISKENKERDKRKKENTERRAKERQQKQAEWDKNFMDQLNKIRENIKRMEAGMFESEKEREDFEEEEYHAEREAHDRKRRRRDIFLYVCLGVVFLVGVFLRWDEITGESILQVAVIFWGLCVWAQLKENGRRLGILINLKKEQMGIKDEGFSD